MPQCPTCGAEDDVEGVPCWDCLDRGLAVLQKRHDELFCDVEDGEAN